MRNAGLYQNTECEFQSVSALLRTKFQRCAQEISIWLNQAALLEVGIRHMDGCHRRGDESLQTFMHAQPR